MKTLNRFIIEKLKLGKDTQIIKYHFFPKNVNELRSLLEQLLEERGQDADLNDIDVSKITSFYHESTNIGLFENLYPRKINISKWNVSNVENMCNMFRACTNFNCDLSEWDVSNVKNMSFMFYRCTNFKGAGLEKWNVNKVKNTQCMFYRCTNFNCNLSEWDVSNVINMHAMFDSCKKLDCDLSNWDVRNVVLMRYMFDGCNSLKNIPNWYKY